MSIAPRPFIPHDLAHPLHGAPSGPLSGLCVAVKDAYDIKGEHTGIGSPEWLAAHAPATRTAAAVARVLDAGATVIGKTVSDEFMYSITGANARYWTPLNPRAPDRLPGGSSSGSASAVAAGACDIGMSTDTGGSTRLPAGMCGIHGFRPTHGRVDMTGVQAMAPSFDSAGWLTQGPGLLRAVGRVLLTGDAVHVPVERVLLGTDLLGVADGTTRETTMAYLHRAGGDLHAQTPVRVAPQGLTAWTDCFRVIQSYETWQTFGAWITAHKPALGPGIRERMAFAESVEASAVEEARARREEIVARLHELLVPGTILAMPTAPSAAPLLSSTEAELDSFRTRCLQLTCPGGLGGLPQVVVPAGLSDGAPVGISFLGWPGGDEALLDLACALARHAGGSA